MNKDIELSKLKPWKNYRRIFDEAATKELTASVKEKGVLQPLIVREGKGGFEIIVGGRRYLAAKAAGLKTVPCIVKKLSDAEAFEMSLVENEQRENPDLMDSALGYKRALAEGHHTMDTLTKKIGKSPAYVLARLKLADLPESIQAQIVKHKLPIGYALLFVRLKEEKDMKEFMKAILERGASVKEAQRMLEQYYGANLKEAPFDKADCLECPARSTNVLTLFPELKNTDQCTDPHCYIGKVKAHYRPLVEKWRQEGKVVIDKTEAMNSAMNKGQKIALLGPKSQSDYTNREAKKKCVSCERVAYFCVESKDYQGRTHVNVGAICPDMKCYRDDKKVVTGGAAMPKDNTNSQSAIAHAKDARNRFLWLNLPSRTAVSKTIPLRLAIYHILDKHNAISNDKAELMRKYEADTSKNLYHAILSVPVKKLEGMLLDAVLYSIRYTDPGVLLLAAPEAGIDVKADFVMDAVYLKSKTKSQLAAIGAKMQVGISEDMKKPEMIEVILAGKLKGVTTTDIDAQLKQPPSDFRLNEETKRKPLEGAVVTFEHKPQPSLKAVPDKKKAK